MHGAVYPFTVWPKVGQETLEQIVAHAAVPVWVPRVPPPGWVVTGLGSAGDDRTGARATVVLLSGPAPLGGPADLALVAEEPGIGLGARLAGLAEPDPGPGFDSEAAHAKVEAIGHPTPLWSLPGAKDCAAFVGEAKGLWLWAVLWPPEAGILMLEPINLDDASDGNTIVQLAFGAPSPRLSAAPPGPG